MRLPSFPRPRLLRFLGLPLIAVLGLGLLLVDPTPSRAASISPWQSTVWAWVSLSRPVAGVGQDGFVVSERDSGVALPALTLCKNGNTDVPCTSGRITRVGLFPNSPFRLGEYYTVAAAPRLLDADGRPPLIGSNTFRAGPREEDQGGSTSFDWATRGQAAANGKSYTVENRARATATLNFSGSSVYIWTALSNTHGQFDVYVDNLWRRSFDSYGRTTQFTIPVGVTGLAPGPHRLDVVVKGTKQPASRGTNVVLDAVSWPGTVLLTPPFTYGWGPGDNPVWSTGLASASEMPGARASISFRGPVIDVATMQGTASGIFRASIDGRPAGEFDDYAPFPRRGVRRFTATGDGMHTLEITPTGSRNRMAARAFAGVDFWEIPESPTAPPAPAQRVAPPPEDMTRDRQANLPDSIPAPPSEAAPTASGGSR